MAGRRLYCGRVAERCTRRDLEDFFGAIGPLSDARPMGNFAFVEFADLKDAQQAVEEYDGKEFLGQSITVQYAKPPRNLDPERYDPRFDRSRGGGGGYDRGYDRGGGGYDDRRGGGGYGSGYGSGGYGERRGPRGGTGVTLKVKDVPEDVSWQDLKDFGREAGNVVRADVDRSTGTGTIEFGSREDADTAIRQLTTLKGAPVRLVEDDGAGANGRNGGGYGARPDRYDDRRDDRRSDDRGYGRDSRGDDRRDRDYGSTRRSRSPPPPRRRSRSPGGY